MLRVVNATRYVLPFREGGSVPALVEASDLGMYVVKLRGAGQGVKALIAELIAGELARALGLSVPEIVYVDLDGSLAASEPDPELAEPLERSAGRNLGLDYLPGCITFDPIADPKTPPALASAIVMFDAFVTNVDRTPRNPNLLVWHRRLWLIDHGASFYFHHGWDPKDRLSGSGEPFVEVRHHVLLARATALPDAAQRMRETFTDALFERVVGDVPHAWLAEDGAFAAESEHRAAYVNWLRARRDVIPALLEEARCAVA